MTYKTILGAAGSVMTLVGYGPVPAQHARRAYETAHLFLAGVVLDHCHRVRRTTGREGWARIMGDRRKHARVLTTRRARLIPEQVGLPPTRSRRVPCLRRSEVASVAGLSVEYYARLERGQIAGASSGVVEALARALQVDETESAHLSPSPDNAELGALAEYLHPTRVFAPPQALHPRSSGGQSNDSQTDDLTSATCP